MGTISEKLTYLNETKQELKQKINNLGGSIDDNTTFRNYANQLQNVYDNLPKTEYQEGTEVNLGKTIKGKLDYENGVVGIGQTEQDGTPTPSQEIPIKCVTGNQDVVVSGINKLPNNLTNETINNVETTINNDKSIKLVGTASQQTDIYLVGDATNYESLDIVGQCYLRGCLDGSGSTYMLYAVKKDKSGNITYHPEFTGHTGITINEGDTFRVFIRILNGTAINTIMCPMLSQVSSDPYEPYITPTSYQLSLGDIELNAIGNYKDELIYDVDEDRVYKNEKIGKKVFTGASEESWNYSVNDAFFYTNEILNLATPTDSFYCNYFESVAINSSTPINMRSETIKFQTSSIATLFLKYTDISTLANFKTWLSTHNTEVRYVKVQATLTEITDTTLINQVKALYNAHSNNGTTIITSNGNLPMIIKVRGLKGE